MHTARRSTSNQTSSNYYSRRSNSDSRKLHDNRTLYKLSRWEKADFSSFFPLRCIRVSNILLRIRIMIYP